MRTCARWQRMCSSSGMSRLRLRDGRASKSRLRGQFDKAFIGLNCARDVGSMQFVEGIVSAWTWPMKSEIRDRSDRNGPGGPLGRYLRQSLLPDRIPGPLPLPPRFFAVPLTRSTFNVSASLCEVRPVNPVVRRSSLCRSWNWGSRETGWLVEEEAAEITSAAPYTFKQGVIFLSGDRSR